MREALGFSRDQKGVLLMEVTPNGPAAKAGLGQGDLILSVDGRAVNTPTDLLGYVVRRPIGSRVRVTYLHPASRGARAQERTAEVKIIARPSEAELAKGLH